MLTPARAGDLVTAQPGYTASAPVVGQSGPVRG